jgi:hypothetical protein
MNREMFIAIAVGMAVFAGMAHGDLRGTARQPSINIGWARQISSFSKTAKSALMPFEKFKFHLSNWR